MNTEENKIVTKKVSREIAEEEIEYWLDKKKVRESQRSFYKESVEILTDAMMDGDLVLDKDTNELTYTLSFPTEGTAPIKNLKFKARLNDAMLKPHMETSKSGTLVDVNLSYLAALTDVPKTVLAKLDTVDKRVISNVVVFFL